MKQQRFQPQPNKPPEPTLRSPQQSELPKVGPQPEVPKGPIHGCFFADGRRADFVLVLESRESLRDIVYYIRTLESLGLQFEGVPGNEIDKYFVLVHIPTVVVLNYADVINVGKEEKINMRAWTSFNTKFNICTTPISSIPEKQEGEYTSCDRIYTIRKILETTSFSSDASDVGLAKLRKLKLIVDSYPLHDGKGEIRNDEANAYANDRQLLLRYFANFSCWYKELPLDMINKYFGSEIGFYFAWVELFNTMLLPAAILGVLLFFISVFNLLLSSSIPQIDETCLADDMYICPACEFQEFCMFRRLSTFCSYAQWGYVFDNYYTMIFAVMMSFWATLFLNLWRRRENQLKLKWDVQYEEAVTDSRQEYIDSVKRRKYNYISGRMEPYIPGYIKALRVTLTTSICIFLGFLVLMAIFGVILFKIIVAGIVTSKGNTYFKNHAVIIAMVTGSVMQVVFIKFFGLLYGPLSICLTNIENPRTQKEFDNSVLYKRYLLAFVNNYTALFYIAFVKGKLYSEPYHHGIYATFERDVCQPLTCVVPLCVQLAFLMLLKRLVSNTIVLIRSTLNCCKNNGNSEDQNIPLPQYEEDYKLLPTNRYLLTTEFSEMMITYGFVTCFVAVFPLAPLFALLNNLLEVRLDAYKLVCRYRRPLPRKTAGIGAWGGVMLGVTYLSTATNAFVIAFTSDFVTREVYKHTKQMGLEGFVNATLSVFNTTDYDLYEKLEPKLDICYYRSMRFPPSSPTPYALTGTYWVHITCRLITVFIFEHVVLLLNSLLSYAIPDVPYNVRTQLKIDKQLAKDAKLRMVKDEMKKSGKKGERILHGTSTLSRLRLVDSAQ